MTIGYTLVGNGAEKVMVFHGWFGDYSVWEPTFSAMDTDTFTYAFLDYRGYGKSAEQTGDYSMAEIAADANAVAKKLDWTEFNLIGHSMGGMAMQRMILDCDDSMTIKSAVGVTPVPACGGGPLDADATALFEGAIQNNENRYGILDFTTGGRLSAAWLSNMVKASRDTTNEAAFGGYLAAWVKENFADEVGAIKTPMMVCVGEHDGAISADAMRGTYLQWFEGCELEVIANCGHYPMQETPVYLMTMIEAFMKKNS